MVPAQNRTLREITLTVNLQEWEANQSASTDFVELLLQALERDRYPELEQPAVCQGCVHYHGEVYVGGQGVNWLCCALHPKGPEEEVCRDRELAP
jgi:hypothetical protein